MLAKIISRITFQLLIIAFSFLSVSKGFSQDIPITVESGVIPPYFNMDNDTLIIASTGNPFYAGSMKRHFKKNYTGPFILTNKFDEHPIKNCRYILFEGTSSTTIIDLDGPNKGKSRNMVAHGSFYILDRKTNKQYVNLK